MLVCPQCQFENPNTNKFCQKCGTSLSHKICGQCGSGVAFSEEHCQNCGAIAGTVRLAAILNIPDWQLKEAAVAASAPPAPSLVETPSNPVSPTEGNAEEAPLDAAASFTQAASSNIETTDIGAQVSATNEAESTLTTASSNINPSIIEAENPAMAGKTQVQELSGTESSDRAIAADPASVQSATPDAGLIGSLAILPQDDIEGKSGSSDMPSETPNNAPSPVAAIASENSYLDPQQRYRLLSSVKSIPSEGEGVETALNEPALVRVLDCQPYQKSPLEALMDQQSSTSGGRPHALTSDLLNSDSWKAIAIPAPAQPYLALQEQMSPAIPKIHDAWQQDGDAIVLLEDRLEWQLLADLWGKDEVPPFQMLYWLGEMAKLWAALEPWKCRQSLLLRENLRLDEDQKICLVALYRERDEAQAKLSDLGQMWQVLFSQSQRTQFGSVDELCRDLRQGGIVTMEQLRDRLEAIASELQANQESASKEIGLMNDTLTQPDYAVTQANLEFKGSDLSEGDDIETIILPMQLLSLEDAGTTDIGRMREHNEDYFGIQTFSQKQESPMGRTIQARGLYILCDGMGGHAGGEVASVMAVETLRRFFQANWKDEMPQEETIREAVRLANKAIYDVNQQNARSGSGRMGTTLVIVLVQDTKVAVAHVGDSRLYRVSRKRNLEQVTVDHEVGQREISRGVEPAIAYSRPDAYQLTQALGPRDEQFVNPDVQFLELNEDTLLVLCSDGMSDHDLLESCWQTHLLPLLSSRANLDQGLAQLIDLANQQNGHDNITAVIVRAKVRPNLDQPQMF
ncbi:serine/threonine phosphatase [Microcoleus sp. FACHB-831]|uniref:serine/threonine phosphatase n=1 Tax=Microcoleus sp. FACHB-831 TaxID=2692827 RepID=UPI001684054C|nr:serine/threonine phosphatase [Microcoleus sp. FACHB-831]MBD1922672.1 serine/threonine phosphatase [Microcoleus sp. FACHB-831]